MSDRRHGFGSRKGGLEKKDRAKYENGEPIIQEMKDCLFGHGPEKCLRFLKRQSLVW
jgi:hypothetical protein